MTWLDENKLRSLNNKSAYLKDEVDEILDTIIENLNFIKCKNCTYRRKDENYDLECNNTDSPCYGSLVREIDGCICFDSDVEVIK